MNPRQPSGTLTRNQSLVLECLRREGRAMTAYDLLDALRDDGLRAPAQVYRALEALGQRELVHRIETLNAFVACRHFDHSETAAFAICDDCRHIWEFALPSEAGLTAAADRKGFKTRNVTVELHGRCADCAGRASG
jgi:Fur family transcriptional regulator, zinc uptake regulator